MNTELLEKALTLSTGGRLKEAQQLYQTLRTTPPGNIDELSKLGLVAINLGDIGQALKLSENVQELEPVNAYSYCNLGDLYNCLGKFEEAIEAFTKAISLNPKLVPYGLVHAYETLGQFVRADHILSALSHIGNSSPGTTGTSEKKAVLVCALPKSAGSSITDSLRKYGGYKHSEVIATMNVNRMPYSRLCKQAFLHSLQQQVVLHTHLVASKYNIGILGNSEINRIVVHSRDPRQAVLSYFYHCQSGLGLGRCLAENSQYRTLDHDNKMQWFVRTYFPLFVNWISEWTSFETCATEYSLELKITSFEQMTKGDPHEFLAGICEFLDIPVTDGMSIDKKRYRKGQTDEWRTVLDESLRDWMWDSIPPILKEKYGWIR